MQHKISDLEGVWLDAAVGKANGWDVLIDLKTPLAFVWKHPPEADIDEESFSPTSDWSIAGPIIEREKIRLTFIGDEWEAQIVGKSVEHGPTALIAAMRAFVCAYVGDDGETIDLP